MLPLCRLTVQIFILDANYALNRASYWQSQTKCISSHSHKYLSSNRSKVSRDLMPACFSYVFSSVLVKLDGSLCMKFRYWLYIELKLLDIRAYTRLMRSCLTVSVHAPVLNRKTGSSYLDVATKRSHGFIAQDIDGITDGM